MNLYRNLQKKWVVPHVVPRVVEADRVAAAPALSTFLDQVSSPQADTHRVWFHAASTGELESLWPVIETWIRASDEIRREAVVTVFSQSAYERAVELGREIDGIVYAGYSPWEGQDVAVWPSLTIFRGKVVVEDGQFHGSTADGRYLKRSIPEDIRARQTL